MGASLQPRLGYRITHSLLAVPIIAARRRDLDRPDGRTDSGALPARLEASDG